MPVRGNGFYNNPQFAQAAANLGALFAPPSGADAAGWAAANAKKEEAARLAQLFTSASGPEFNQPVFDRQAVAAGIYNPTQSYYAQDQNNGTTIRGQDVAASTSRANNTADNIRALEDRRLQELTSVRGQDLTANTARYGIDTVAGTSRANNADDNIRALEDRRLQELTAVRGQDITAGVSRANNAADNGRQAITSLYGALNPGQVRPQVDAEMLRAIGLDLPTMPAVSGAPKPMTDDELKASIIGSQPENIQRAYALGATPVENVATPEGPRTMFRADAVGQEPYFNKGAEAKPQNAIAVMPGGAQVPARQGADGVWVHAQTGQPLPADIKIFDLPKATGTASEVGLAPTVANMSQANNQEAEITRSLQLADIYENALDNNPGALGLAGLIRGTAQNAAQTANDLARSFGGDVPQVKALADEVRSGLQGVAPQLFDPSIPEIQFLQGTLAYSLARTENPSGEVSRQAYDRALERVGGGSILANQQSAKAAVQALRKVLGTQLQGINTLRAPGTGRTDTTFQPPPAGTAVAPPPAASTGAVEKWIRVDGKLMKAN